MIALRTSPRASKPIATETRTEALRMDIVALADELRDQELPGRVRQAVETIRHWKQA